MYSLHGKVILITGGSNGIGESIVKETLDNGAQHVTFLDIDAVSGKKLEIELKHKYGEEKIKFIQCDITKDEELFSAYSNVIDKFNTLDVIINNAAIVDDSPDMYKKEIEINFTATVTSTMKALEMMRIDKGGKGGTVINISSISALSQLSPTYFIYAATKSAVLHFSNSIGMDNYYRRTNVRVVTVCFGKTHTNIGKNLHMFDPNITLEELVEAHKHLEPGQTSESAARGVVEVYSKAISGSTWLVNYGQVKNITDNVNNAYAELDKGIQATNI